MILLLALNGWLSRFDLLLNYTRITFLCCFNGVIFLQAYSLEAPCAFCNITMMGRVGQTAGQGTKEMDSRTWQKAFFVILGWSRDAM